MCVAQLPFIEKPQNPDSHKVRSIVTVYNVLTFNWVTVPRTLKSVRSLFSINGVSPNGLLLK